MLIGSKYDGYSRDGQREYHKGGGDPGAEARAQESARQERIRQATDEINKIFGAANSSGDSGQGRDELYNDHRGAVYDINKMDVDRQAAEASRAARFGLARSGLSGGSADIDAHADIDRRTNEGLLRAGGIADQSAADLKTADERTRSNLLSMAQSGIDTGSAATMALQGLKVNADNVASAKAGATVGGLFNDMSQAYLYNQRATGGAGGTQQPGQQWYGVSSPQQTYGGTSK